MKKILSIVFIIISFLVVFFVQSNFFSWFTIAGIQPNLFIILILCVGLIEGKKLGLILGVLFGLFLDVVIGRQIGISGIMLGLVGLIGEYLDKNFSKESRITIMIMVVVSTFIYETGAYLIGYFIYGYSLEIFSFIQILLIECFYNVIITIIFYPLMQNLGYKIEEVYKGNKILTRYF